MTRRSTLPNVDIDPNLARFLEKIDTRRLTPIDPVETVGGDAVDPVDDTAITPVDDTAITAVDTEPATDTTPFGYTTQDQADAIVTAINELIARQADIITAVNAINDRLSGTITTVNSLTSSASQSEQAGSDTRAKLNELLDEMKLRGAMEKGESA